MHNKEKHTCNSCIHYEICEWPIYEAEIICDDYISNNIRLHGEWIPNYTSQFRNPGRQCSICGKIVEFSENFCPDCGAIMKR